ncbi:component of the polarisome [Tieghemiomyces parasiticus]|uniref:Component of the polarisome n=1 Tax=Tieghemiomyces parasiticus TaxID=78921 RepID=A0A9W7ZSK2_9FUNG|nr:component of the polarisome [Tieghemiomyces parasiticus]
MGDSYSMASIRSQPAYTNDTRDRPPHPRQTSGPQPTGQNYSASMASLNGAGKPASIDSAYMHPQSGGRPPSRHTEDLERLKQDHERQVRSLQQQVEALEESLARSGQDQSQKLNLLNDNNQLQLDLQESQQKTADLERELSSLKKEAERLREEGMEHQRSLRFGAEKDRDEKDNLRRQIGRLTSELGELKTQNEHYSRRMKKLMDEKMELEAKLAEAKEAAARAPALPTPTLDRTGQSCRDERISVEKPPEGGIDRARMSAFQQAIDELVRAGRSNQPTDVLVAMKSVVLACRAISEDTEQYETQHRLPGDERTRLHSYQGKLSTTLNELTATAKRHAAGMGLSPTALLDAAATHLTEAVLDLVRLVKLRPSSSTGSLTLSSPPTPRSVPVRKPSTGGGVHDDTSFASRSSNTALGHVNGTSGGHPPPTPNSAHGDQYLKSTITLTAPAATNGYGIKSGSWDLSRLMPGGFGGSNNGNHRGGSRESRDSTASGVTLSVDELRDFLEAKTDQAVQGIQDMLRTSRAEEVDPITLCLNLRAIVATVSSILQTCRVSFDHFAALGDPQRAHSGLRPLSYTLPPAFDPAKARNYLDGLRDGDHVLQTLVAEIYKAAQMAAINNQFAGDSPNPGSALLLNGASPRPGALHEFQIDNQDLDTEVVHDLVNDKIFKQRLTSAVFDVARCTKFLVSLME